MKSPATSRVKRGSHSSILDGMPGRRRACSRGQPLPSPFYRFFFGFPDCLGGTLAIFRTIRLRVSSSASTPASASMKRRDCSSWETAGFLRLRGAMRCFASENFIRDHWANCPANARGRRADRWPSLPWAHGSRRRLTPLRPHLETRHTGRPRRKVDHFPQREGHP